MPCSAVAGIDEVTQQGASTEAGQAQMQQAVATRTSQAQEAQQARGQGDAASGTLKQLVSSDQQKAGAVAQEAQTESQTSRGAEQSLAQQAAAVRQQRQQKWGSLMSWAATHRGMRQTVVPGAQRA